MALSDDELWEKCKQNVPITAEDLGLRTLNNEEPFYWTEGERLSIRDSLSYKSFQ